MANGKYKIYFVLVSETGRKASLWQMKFIFNGNEQKEVLF
jgi:hypothetical protein